MRNFYFFFISYLLIWVSFISLLGFSFIFWKRGMLFVFICDVVMKIRRINLYIVFCIVFIRVKYLIYVN